MKISKLRHWKHADAKWLRDLDSKCFVKAEASFTNDERHHWWIAESTDLDVIAYAGLVLKRGGKLAHFVRCGVTPFFRGCGMQRRLIETRLAWCRRRGVEVVTTYCAVSNTHSRDNLRSAGFSYRGVGKWLRFRKELE